MKEKKETNPNKNGSFDLNFLPSRPKKSNKGTFGRALLICGSDSYPGAAHLAAEACLRGGAGYTVFSGEERLSRELRMRFPELLFVDRSVETILSRSEKAEATLCGPGLGISEWLSRLVTDLLKLKTNSPLVLDADAINVLAGRSNVLKNANRPVVLTPHPLEFSRLSGIAPQEIDHDRIGVSVSFAKEYGVTLLLKGQGTVITDGTDIAVNPTGSSALAKAGSGDVLAGFLTSLLAQGATPFGAAVSAAYIHGLAGDTLAEALSEYGVTPSDLPLAMAKILGDLTTPL